MDDEIRRLSKAAEAGDAEAGKELVAGLKRLGKCTDADIRAYVVAKNMGGLVSLSWNGKIDEERALAALEILWEPGAVRVLSSVVKLREGEETGSTFTGTLESYERFESAIQGTGLEAECLSGAFSEAQVLTMMGVRVR